MNTKLVITSMAAGALLVCSTAYSNEITNPIQYQVPSEVFTHAKGILKAEGVEEARNKLTSALSKVDGLVKTLHQSAISESHNVLQRAYELCGLQLQREYGQPWEGDGEEQVRIATMTILGMGKFGGDELNFSSDIDLIYCYSSNSYNWYLTTQFFKNSFISFKNNNNNFCLTKNKNKQNLNMNLLNQTKEIY